MPSLSVGLVFAVSSILSGSWFTRIPEIQNKLGLSEGTLGLALLGTSIGGLLMMPFTPWLMKRFSTGRITLIASLMYCVAAVLPVFAVNYWTLFGALLLLGLASGGMNVAMNAGAVAVERSYRISIMSVCHGMYSLGGMLGAGLSSVIAGLGVTPEVHLTSMALLMIALNFGIRSDLVNMPDSDSGGATFSLPKGPLLGMAFISFCVFLCEGAVADWSAVYLLNTLGGSPFVAGLGYAGFALMMTLGRFQGDSIVSFFGAKRLLQFGALLGAVGVAMAVLVPVPAVAIIGFTMLGLGFSSLVPIIFRAAANVPGIASGTGIAAVTTAGTFGLLSGPPLIGFVAEGFGLTIGLAVVAALAFLASLLARTVKA